VDYKVAMAARTKVLKSLSQRTMQLRLGKARPFILQCDGRKNVSRRVPGVQKSSKIIRSPHALTRVLSDTLPAQT
jgi:hypothetical protein